MAGEKSTDGSRGTRVFAAISILVAVAGLLTLLLPGVAGRKYPQREKIVFWHMWTAESKDVIDRIVDRFNASQEKYEVLALSVPGQNANAKFLLSVAGGDAPDVMAQWTPIIPQWAESNLLLRVDEELMTPGEVANFRQNVYPVCWKMGAYKNHLYGIATGLDTYALYYRTDFLREAGLDPNHLPKTLEGIVEWGKKLDKFDKDGNLIRAGFVPQTVIQYAPGFGEGFFDWKNARLLINTPSNLQALEFLVRERQRLGFDNVVRFNASLASTEGLNAPFLTGQFAMLLGGQWDVKNIKRYKPNLPYGTAPLPPPEGGNEFYCRAGGNFMVFPRNARNSRGAWEFTKFWSGLEQPERAAEFYTWGGWLPLSPAITNSPIYQQYLRDNPTFRPFLEMMPSEHVHPYPQVTYSQYFVDQLIQAEDSAMRGSISPRQALERLQREVANEAQSRKELGYAD